LESLTGQLLRGKVALITGAASGQGRAAAQLFAEHGATIVVADINDVGGKETVRLVEDAGQSGQAVHADVSRRADVDAMIGTTIDAYGRLDVLYNNAAVQMSGRLVDCTEDDWDLTIATNLSAIFWACRAAIPHMLAGETPRFRKVLDQFGGDAERFVEGLRTTVPLKRLGVAEDVAGIALFLASDLSAYTSGAVIPADGGLAALR
jgi:NAD(P)-dependent dehydrogenase (short-subunit alcohol dehydrogenase family)